MNDKQCIQILLRQLKRKVQKRQQTGLDQFWLPKITIPKDIKSYCNKWKMAQCLRKTKKYIELVESAVMFIMDLKRQKNVLLANMTERFIKSNAKNFKKFNKN